MKKVIFWIFAISFLSLGCGGGSVGDKGGKITRVSGKIYHEITEQPIANYTLYVEERFSSGVGFSIRDSVKTNSQGDYDLVFISKERQSYELLIPGVATATARCYKTVVLEEGRDIKHFARITPLQPLFVFRCQQKAQQVGATQVEVNLSTGTCTAPTPIIDPTKPENIFYVAPNSEYRIQAVFRKYDQDVYSFYDTISIGTSPYIYTAK